MHQMFFFMTIHKLNCFCCFQPSNAGYYDPSSQFSSSLSASRGGGAGDSFSDSNKFGGVSSATDSTSSPVPSTAATQQPAPFNALGNLGKNNVNVGFDNNMFARCL